MLKSKMMLPAILAVVALFGFIPKANAVIATRTYTCTHPCDNGNTWTHTETWQTTDNGVTWNKTSSSTTNCDGTVSCSIIGQGTTNLGQVGAATAVYFNSGATHVNITGMPDTLSVDGPTWNISGYTTGPAGQVQVYSLDYDSSGNYSLTNYPAFKRSETWHCVGSLSDDAKALSVQSSSAGLQIGFSLQANSGVTAEVFDMLGHRVYAFETGAELQAGQNSVSLIGSDKIATGAYLLKLTAGATILSQKIIISN